MPTPRSVANALTGRQARLATAYLVLAGAGVALHRALPVDSLEQNLVYDGIGLSAVVAVIVGILHHRPSRMLPWVLVAGAHLAFVVGDALWTGLELLGESPFPSIADVAYLAGYPMLVVAFAICIRLRVRGGDQSGLLDGSILAAAAALVGWVTLVRPVLDAADDPLSLVISAAYPLGDLVVIGVAIGLLATPGARTPSFVLLVAAIGQLFVADTAYAFQQAVGVYQDGGLLDSLWLGSYLTVGAAALHGSMREVAAPHPVSVAWLSRVRLSLLALALLTGPGLVMIVDLRWETDVPMLAAGSAGLSLLVLMRLATVVRALARDNAARMKLEGELSHRAAHDPLTGLPNRRRFIERLEGSVEVAARRPLSVLFIDLDDFKTVNDSLGHAAGDALLIAIAARLQGHLRDEDLAARLGGDEFGIILDGQDASVAVRVAERLLATLREPIDVAGRQLVVRASIGIADGSGPGVTAAGLLSDADIAMYQAKSEGKGRARTYIPGARNAVQERLELESDLRHAVGRDQLRLEYQPIVELATGRTVAVEALVRWDHPTRGPLLPGAFIPLAEGAGLIGLIGAWVMTEACRQAAAWRTLAPELAMSVNLSPQQLAQPDIVPLIEGATAAADLPVTALIVEVTESALLEDGGMVIANLERIRALGVRVAIDDFGTGYSSLSYLSRLPADILKIDRAFVAELDRSEDRGLAMVVLRVGETLGLETIAEGVERDAQLEALRGLGCRLVQGYLLSAPLRPDAVTARLGGRPPVRAGRPAVRVPHAIGSPAAG